MRHLNVGLALAAVIAPLATGWAIVRITPSDDWRLWLAILAATLCAVLAFASTGRVLFVSPQIALVVMYVMLIHVGSIGFYLSDPLDNKRLLLISSLAMLAFSVPLGYACLRRRPVRLEGGVINDLVGDKKLAWEVFAVLGVLGALYYLLRGTSATGGLPLLRLFHGFASVHSLAESRLGFTTGTTGYLYEFYGVILPVSAVAFMLQWLSTGSRRHRRRALLLLGLTAFTLIAAGYRGPIELFLVLIAISLSYALGGLKNKAGLAIGVLAAMAFVLLSLGIYSNPGVGTTAEQGIVARLFQVQADGPAFVTQTYPYPYPYTGGASLVHDLQGALPGRQAGFSTEIVDLRGVKSLNNPIGAAFDAYVNFGPVGTVGLMFLMGCATLAVHRRLARKRTASAIALGSGLSAALAYGALAGIAGVLLQFGVVTVALMTVVQSLLRFPGPRQTTGWVFLRPEPCDEERIGFLNQTKTYKEIEAPQRTIETGRPTFSRQAAPPSTR